jgi:hypothetical protein
MDGVTTTVNFKAAAQGTTNGSTSGGYTLFAVDDGDTIGDSTSAIDAATNLVAAINSVNGLPDLEAYANRVSDTDTTTANGKVYLKARDADDATNTAIVTSGDVSGTCTITITDFTELNSSDKVNLIATDGTNYDFVNGDQSSVAGTWESTTSNDVTATNLMNVINTSSGPAGTRFTATVLGAVVTVTQATAGSAGNTTVTLTDSGTTGMSKTDFTGGIAFTDSTSVNPPATFTGGVDETVDITKNKWSRKGSAENAAESLKDAINETSSGHGYSNGLTAARSGAVLTITQNVAGATGNTSVAYNNEFQEICSILPKSFTGGAAATTPKLGIQYSTNGTDWTSMVEIAADVAADVTGIKLFTLPEVVTSYPAYRLIFNPNLTNAGTSGKLTFVGAY